MSVWIPSRDKKINFFYLPFEQKNCLKNSKETCTWSLNIASYLLYKCTANSLCTKRGNVNLCICSTVQPLWKRGSLPGGIKQIFTKEISAGADSKLTTMIAFT